MSDADLRELERRFRETGSVDDEAAWLRARIQAGELSEGRLRLAIYFGHAGSSDVLDQEIPVIDRLWDWADGVPRSDEADQRIKRAPSALSQEACVRAAIAAARLAVAAQGNPPPTPLVAVEAAEALLHRPCDEHLAAATEAGGAAEEVADDDLRTASPLTFHACRSAAEACFTAYGFVHPDFGLPGLGMVLSVASDALAGSEDERLRGAICDEIIPWALGYSDPVRERVEARQRAEAAGG